MKLAFFGSSLLSAYWNGAATYWRGIIHALSQRGHQVTFYEPDTLDRQQHRDIANPSWARVVVYPCRCEMDALVAVGDAVGRDDVIIKCSGVGIYDELLESAVLERRRPGQVVAFWDVDAPATLDRMQRDPEDSLRRLVEAYDLVLTYGGGEPVVKAYRALGARDCVPIYNAVDPRTHYPVPAEPRFMADLAFLGNRLPDREARVAEFFLKPAEMCASRRFLLGGSGWSDKAEVRELANVVYLGHVYTTMHNAFNCTPRAVLNVSRESMARCGHSPATRVFEAAGAGACIITDAWPGLERFLEPGVEVLVADSGEAVAAHLERLTPERAARIGRAARARVLREHTYEHRAAELERVLARYLPVSGSSSVQGVEVP
ncbi:MAG: CgeB family protein [Phycisphaeraceae bacterium]